MARRPGSARILVGVAVTSVLLSVAGDGDAGGHDPATGPGPIAARPVAADTRPNILLVVTDDQRAGTVTPQVMPNIYRELVQHGFRFTRSFVTNPWCCPSRASILTGQYSHTNGVWTVGSPAGITAWFPHESSTLATWLRGAGYRTGIIGKYLNGYGKPSIPAYEPPGWDTTAIVTDLDYSENPGYFDYDLFDGTGLVHYGTEPSDYSTRVLTDRALSFIAPTTAAQPWFLYLAYTSPHGPAVNDPVDDDAARGITYPMPANVCEQDVSDKPAFIRGSPRAPGRRPSTTTGCAPSRPRCSRRSTAGSATSWTNSPPADRCGTPSSSSSPTTACRWAAIACSARRCPTKSRSVCLS
jgi:arylsulfatase A-like enzyme